MKKFLHLLQNGHLRMIGTSVPGSDGKLKYDSSLVIPKFTPEQVAENDQKPFWEGLETLGYSQEEQSKLIIMIRNGHKATDWFDPYHNRRALYQSLMFLRYKSKTGWRLDQQRPRLAGDVRTVLDKAMGRGFPPDLYATAQRC